MTYKGKSYENISIILFQVYYIISFFWELYVITVIIVLNCNALFFYFNQYTLNSTTKIELQQNSKYKNLFLNLF